MTAEPSADRYVPGQRSANLAREPLFRPERVGGSLRDRRFTVVFNARDERAGQQLPTQRCRRVAVADDDARRQLIDFANLDGPVPLEEGRNGRAAYTGIELDEKGAFRIACPALGGRGIGAAVCRRHRCQLRDQHRQGNGGTHGEMPSTSNSHVPLTLPATPLGRPTAV